MASTAPLNSDTRHAPALRGLQCSLSAMAIAATLAGGGAQAATFTNWSTVVNNAVFLPGSDSATFFSYNQPSVSATGDVVFRARARTPQGGEENEGGGDSGGTVQGVFLRDMSFGGGAVTTLAQTGLTLVPDPNNLGAVFRAVPSFPRIDADGNIAFRGQSEPVWSYIPDPNTGEESRVGTTGVFGTAGGGLTTGASQLGAVSGFEYFAVPATAGIRFDQFPGAPSPTGSIVTFKSNWTDENGVGQTGVYFRDVTADGGESPTGVIAQRGMAIPAGGGVSGSGATFGSTAAPSAAGNKVVFTGLDNEEAPTAGGIYLATIETNPVLTPLVDFASGVPGKPGETFNRFGEGLSFDGGRVAFWGA